MKRLFLTLCAVALWQFAFATFHHITIDNKNLTYLPTVLNAAIGDTVLIEASGMHPLVQVDASAWAANDATPMSDGFGVQTADYQFVIAEPGTIYYVCQAHVQSGMKGTILVDPTGVAENTTNAPEIKVYPTYVNSGTFTVLLTNAKIDQPVINLYNMAGQLAEKHTLSKAQNAVDTDLPPGMYIYTIGNASNSKVLKTGKVIITNK